MCWKVRWTDLGTISQIGFAIPAIGEVNWVSLFYLFFRVLSYYKNGLLEIKKKGTIFLEMYLYFYAYRRGGEIAEEGGESAGLGFGGV